MAEQLRREDLIARVGGDEFGVLLSGIGERQARGVFERLRAAVAGKSIEARAGAITASIGFAGSDRCASPAELLVAAEGALRTAKREGGDRIVRA